MRGEDMVRTQAQDATCLRELCAEDYTDHNGRESREHCTRPESMPPKTRVGI